MLQLATCKLQVVTCKFYSTCNRGFTDEDGKCLRISDRDFRDQSPSQENLIAQNVRTAIRNTVTSNEFVFTADTSISFATVTRTHRRWKPLGRAGRGPPTFLPLWAANVSGPPTFGHLIRPKKYPICVLKDELFSADKRVALITVDISAHRVPL